jgi:hypothetical protein
VLFPHRCMLLSYHQLAQDLLSQRLLARRLLAQNLLAQHLLAQHLRAQHLLAAHHMYPSVTIGGVSEFTWIIASALC